MEPLNWSRFESTLLVSRRESSIQCHRWQKHSLLEFKSYHLPFSENQPEIVLKVCSSNLGLFEHYQHLQLLFLMVLLEISADMGRVCRLVSISSGQQILHLRFLYFQRPQKFLCGLIAACCSNQKLQKFSSCLVHFHSGISAWAQSGTRHRLEHSNSGRHTIKICELHHGLQSKQKGKGECCSWCDRPACEGVSYKFARFLFS